MDQEVNPERFKTEKCNIPHDIFLNIPKNIVFPNELNEYLKNQLQLFIHKNVVLQKTVSDSEQALTESNAKNEELVAKIREYEILCGKNEFISSSAVAASKIVELSKKVRERTSELEVYKTKCSKLEHDLFQMKEELQNMEKPEPMKPPNSELENQLKQTQEKLHIAKNKLLETKNQNAQLKNDLKVANKWLQQETGENFESLNNIHNTNSNWRGRAQIICDLQKKNSDLREKLKNVQEKGSSNNTANEVKLDKKIDAYIKQNSELKYQVDDLKKRCDGSRAKARYLDTECTLMKNKVLKLNGYIDDNRQEMSSLMAQLTIEKRFRNESKKQMDLLVSKFKEEKEELIVEMRKKECALQNMIKDLNEQKEELDTLKNTFRGARAVSSTNAHSTKQIRNEDKTVSRLEAELQKLLELTELQGKRLDTERTRHQKTDLELRHERQKTARLEAKVARLELDFSPKSSSYSINLSRVESDTAEMLRNQLELTKENVEALRTRLEVEKHERKVDLQQFASILQIYNNNDEDNP